MRKAMANGADPNAREKEVFPGGLGWLVDIRDTLGWGGDGWWLVGLVMVGVKMLKIGWRSKIGESLVRDVNL